MLSNLSIRNFAIVKSLDIDFNKGMTAITGETGAGKSIAVDALGLCLGDRADIGLVRTGTEKAEVSAGFDVSDLPKAQDWLRKNELDDEEECLIRRVISSEGRSKAYINGTPVPIQQLKSLGQYLLSIHGQHAHQQILKSDMQRELLDNFAEHPNKYIQSITLNGKPYNALTITHQQILEGGELHYILGNSPSIN